MERENLLFSAPPPAVLHFCVKNILLPPSATVFGLTLELLWLLLIRIHPYLERVCESALENQRNEQVLIIIILMHLIKGLEFLWIISPIIHEPDKL